MMRPLALLLALAAGLAPAATRAAEEQATNRLPYSLTGGATLGYRVVDVDGSEAQFREQYDLEQGFRLFDLDLEAVAKEPDKTRLDRFHLEIDTPGDEPVSLFRLSASDRSLYDLKVNFTRSTYFYAWPQLSQEPVAGDVRLDDLHDFDTIRWDGAVDLTVRAPNLPTLFFGYRLYDRSGPATSTVVIPEGDTFVVSAPVDSVTHVGKVGTEFEALNTSVFLQQEYRHVGRRFDQDGPDDDRRGLDPSDASILRDWQARQPEDIDIPATTVRLRRPVGDRLELSGAYFYSHARLDSNAFLFRNGTSNAPPLDGVAQTRDESDATLVTQVADLGATLRATDRVRLHFTYRFNERSEHGDLDQQSTYGPLQTGTSDHLRANRATADVEWQARDDLLLRAGLRYLWRDSYFSLTNEQVSTGTLGAIGDARYRPWSFLDLFARYENMQVDDPLFVPGDPSGIPVLPAREIALTFVNRGTAGVKVRPRPWLAFNYQFVVDSQDNDTFDARWRNLTNSVGLTVTAREGLDLFAGYTHRDIDNRSVIYFAPLYARSLSEQDASEDILTTQLRWDFPLLGQRWSTGWDVAWVVSDNRLAPNLEPGLSTFGVYDLDRIDGGTFLTLHHRWLEPSVEFRMIDYAERVLPANDYRATIIAFKMGRRFSL